MSLDNSLATAGQRPAWLPRRIGRLAYVLCSIAASMLAMTLHAWLSIAYAPAPLSFAQALVAVAGYGPAVAATLILGSLRLRDLGRHRGLAALLLVPLVNVGVMLLLIVCPGERTQQRGLSCPASGTGTK